MIHKNNNCVTVIDQHSLTLPRCLAANTRPLISVNPAQTSRVVYPCFRSYLANVRKYLHESEHESKEFTLRGEGIEDSRKVDQVALVKRGEHV